MRVIDLILAAARRTIVFARFCVSGAVVFGVLACCVLGVIPSTAQAQVQARLQAEQIDTYARLVFKFPEIPGYQIEGSAGVLVMSFDEPIDVTVEGIEVSVPDFISVGRIDPDGRAIRFALIQPINVNTTEAGPDLYVDLLPKSWSGAPPGLPAQVIQDLARRAEEAEERARLRLLRERMRREAVDVQTRVGRLPTFTRLTFDWGDTVEAAVSREEDKIRIKFNRYGSIDFGDLNVQPTPQIAGAESELLEDGLEITLTVDPDARLRAFREDRQFVIDVSNGDFVATLPTGEALIPGTEAANPDTDIDVSSWTPQVPVTNDQTLSEAARTLSAFDADDLDTDQFVISENDVAPDDPRFAGDETLAEDAVNMEDEDGAEAEAAAAQAEDSDTVRARTELVDEQINLIFPFDAPVSSATFKRANVVWMLFDTPLAIDAQSIQRVGAGRIADVTVTSLDTVQIVRVALANAALVSSATSDNDWMVTIGDEIMAPTTPLQLVRGFREDGDHVISADLQDPGTLHRVQDPIVGDTLTIATAFGPPRGLVKRRQYVDFVALATSHGLAFAPRTQITARIVGDRVIVGRDGGLILTSGDVSLQSVNRSTSSNVAFRSNYVNFDGWRQDPGLSLLNQVGSLELAAANAPDTEVAGVRLAAARLMLANGFYPEAIGQIGLVARSDDAITRDPTFLALRGVTNVLLGRGQEARDDLNDRSLKASPDTKLWLGMVETQERNFGEAQRLFMEGEEVLSSYPENIQSLMRFAAGEAALEVGDVARASFHVEALRDLPLNDEKRGLLDVLEGRLDEANRNTQEALASYDSARKSGVRPVVAQATWRYMALANKTGQVDHDNAIEELEKLIATWRGDENELKGMLTLADVYVTANQPRRAFELLEAADFAHPESPLTRDFHDRMKNAFADLFLRGGADQMSAVRALALYYDFRTLTPIGRDGDEMIRRLADRLISVDLLDQAAELLDHQINQRLRGAARAQVAAQLALVHLINREPGKALRVIQSTRQAVLPATLRRMRTLLEAQALSATDRIDLAMERLNSLEGDDVDRLRADLLWDSAAWQEAGEELELVLGSVWNSSRALSDMQRNDVLRAAIAYSLAGDELGLDRMRRKFSEKMASSPDAASFQVVVSPVGERGGQFRQMVREIADTDTLENFLTEYRERYYPDSVPETADG
ncbi:MAG: hypothetical protein AAGA88_04065 [Pseudomonadota bacterium]